MSAIRSVEVRRAGGDTPLWRLEVADTWLAKLRGLIGRATLHAGTGLYLPGTNGVHMMFMRFPIDCLFLGAPRQDGSRPVVGVRANLRPWRGIVWWVRHARDAVELPSGALAAAGLQKGDLLRLRDVQPGPAQG